MPHRTLANCLKDAETPTVNFETININMAAQPGNYSKPPRWRLSHSHEKCTDMRRL